MRHLRNYLILVLLVSLFSVLFQHKIYEAALEKGEVLSLEAGKTMRTWLKAEAFAEG